MECCVIFVKVGQHWFPTAESVARIWLLRKLLFEVTLVRNMMSCKNSNFTRCIWSITVFLICSLLWDHMSICSLCLSYYFNINIKCLKFISDLFFSSIWRTFNTINKGQGGGNGIEEVTTGEVWKWEESLASVACFHLLLRCRSVIFLALKIRKKLDICLRIHTWEFLMLCLIQQYVVFPHKTVLYQFI